MKKVLIVLMLLLTLTGCNNSGEKYLKPIEVKYDEYTNMVNNKETFALLMWQTGCGHCELFEPKLNNVVKKYNIKMYSINLANLTDDEYNKIKNKTFISGTPTMVYFVNGSKDINKLVGDKSEDEIVKYFEKIGIIK